jgi:hypothetical protein
MGTTRWQVEVALALAGALGGCAREMSADVMMQRDMKSDAGGTMPQKGGVESGKPTMGRTR